MLIRSVALLLSVLFAAVLAANDLREAAEALGRDDFAAAVPHLRAALKEDPANVNARFNLAYALQSSGDLEGAIEQYSLIADQQPELVEARQNLATLLMQAGRFAEAARQYGAIAEASPSAKPPLALRAMALERAGQPADAAGAYRRVLELDPGDLDARRGLARALDSSGMLQEAAREYLALAGHDPDAERALLDLASRLEEAGDGEAALDLYRRHAARNPLNASVQEELGILLLEVGRPAEAARALERSAELEATARRHAALAEAYRQSGDLEASHAQLRLAADADPRDASMRLQLANTLLQRLDFENAAREYLRAVEADPRLLDAWSGLAFSMYRLENFPAALRALAAAESLAPLEAASVYLRAICQDNLQLYEEAQASYRAFLAMTPEMEDETWKATERLRTIAKVLRKR